MFNSFLFCFSFLVFLELKNFEVQKLYFIINLHIFFKKTHILKETIQILSIAFSHFLANILKNYFLFFVPFEIMPAQMLL